jgi:hypothetical protein
LGMRIETRELVDPCHHLPLNGAVGFVQALHAGEGLARVDGCRGNASGGAPLRRRFEVQTAVVGFDNGMSDLQLEVVCQRSRCELRRVAQWVGEVALQRLRMGGEVTVDRRTPQRVGVVPREQEAAPCAGHARA